MSCDGGSPANSQDKKRCVPSFRILDNRVRNIASVQYLTMRSRIAAIHLQRQEVKSLVDDAGNSVAIILSSERQHMYHMYGDSMIFATATA